MKMIAEEAERKHGQDGAHELPVEKKKGLVAPCKVERGGFLNCVRRERIFGFLGRGEVLNKHFGLCTSEKSAILQA